MKTLFDQPLSHRDDPVTSYLAADEILVSGHWGKQKYEVFVALTVCNGLTSAELARRMGISRYITARRLPDLARENIIERGPVRKCEATKRKCVTWFIKEKHEHSRIL